MVASEQLPTKINHGYLDSNKKDLLNDYLLPVGRSLYKVQCLNLKRIW